MTKSNHLDRWLKAYPRAWRERYGDELTALLEDHATDGRLPLRHKLSVVSGGLAERWHTDAGPVAAARQRSGALQVFAAWTAFVIGGINFAKFSEHWQSTVTPAHRHLAGASYAVVQVGALVAATLVIIGAVIVVPTLRRFVRSEGWREVLTRIRIPAALSVASGVSMLGIVFWAQQLSVAQRNGADGAYAWTVAGFSLLAAVCLTSWTVAVVHFVLRLDLSAAVARTEAVLAALLTGLMAAMAAAVVVWWAAMASHAPGFFPSGEGSDASSGSALAPAMILTIVVMGGALALALGGVSRTVTARRV